MNATIERIEKQQIQKTIPPFNIGDTVQVFVKVIEGDRERTQVFEGNVIARRGRSIRETITIYCRTGIRSWPGILSFSKNISTWSNNR